MPNKNSDAWYRTGRANWGTFQLSIKEIEESAKDWKQILEGVKKPWLCWNVDTEWCLIQQKLVDSVGWTPLVGSDPRASDPVLIDSAIKIDFNKKFNLPMMHMLFPVEFAFMYCQKLAFWHSDLLVRKDKLKSLAAVCEALEDGDMALTEPRRSMTNRLLLRPGRYWELLACTTKGASLSQFKHGAGWFANIHSHPNCPESETKIREKKVLWDHGGGIKYWVKNYKKKSQKIKIIDESYLEEGHCTRIRNKNYIPQSPTGLKRDLTKDLAFNYDLKEVCNRLDIDF